MDDDEWWWIMGKLWMDHKSFFSFFQRLYLQDLHFSDWTKAKINGRCIRRNERRRNKPAVSLYFLGRTNGKGKGSAWLLFRGLFPFFLFFFVMLWAPKEGFFVYLQMDGPTDGRLIWGKWMGGWVCINGWGMKGGFANVSESRCVQAGIYACCCYTPDQDLRERNTKISLICTYIRIGKYKQAS